MNSGDWLKVSTKKLSDAGIATARLDCLVLLEDATFKDRSWLLAHPEHALASDLMQKLNEAVARRAQHEPLAFIRGKTEFYGRSFVISAAVLEPRPESETMIDLLKSLKVPADSAIADVGSGSGALGITASLELPKSSVTLLEIDEQALAVSKQNVRLLNPKVSCMQSDLLEHGHTYDVLLANLPYVPDNHTVNDAALQEPRIAIFGGADGLDIYRRLFVQIDGHPNKPSFILTESLPFQHTELAAIAHASGYRQQTVDDFIQVFAVSPDKTNLRLFSSRRAVE